MSGVRGALDLIRHRRDDRTVMVRDGPRLGNQRDQFGEADLGRHRLAADRDRQLGRRGRVGVEVEVAQLLGIGDVLVDHQGQLDIGREEALLFQHGNQRGRFAADDAGHDQVGAVGREIDDALLVFHLVEQPDLVVEHQLELIELLDRGVERDLRVAVDLEVLPVGRHLNHAHRGGTNGCHGRQQQGRDGGRGGQRDGVTVRIVLHWRKSSLVVLEGPVPIKTRNDTIIKDHLQG